MQESWTQRMSEPLDKREALGEGFKWEKTASKEDVATLYADHKAALAANREQKAEIERLKLELAEAEQQVFIESEASRHYHLENISLRASAGEKWIEIKPDTKLNDQMELGRWIRKDKWTITRMEGDAEGWEYTLPNDFFTHYRMLAPPTLPTEKEK
jgi:hypothetical protein